ncbi:hypothetical protein VE01_05647 [Pseudogymnoascus verrucosus]|uniref:Uncharacterized protein n=1 Tax=Pseudogymnoascus verrucosus TaxID=342668 RepID=A0A1B8GKU6_9PEZI|nr:uncharacterized protein VE01_05647 [Pseudogymnoascus verrucosus]OBT96406.2 hypothetical protein VE01_05647 [Pseudogymnoascus verrucosus]
MILIYLYFMVLGVAIAQRPSNSSICDYYTEVKYGSASEANQLKMMQGIVSLAFGGPAAASIESGSVPDGLTGILNPGVHDGVPVNLLPFFNGSIASTNLNNQAVGINWLDDGGILPLVNFMSGKTETVELRNTTNEYRLFGHFYTAFAYIFGCSNPPASPTTGRPPNPAYVHKFMSLNFTEIGHFINQLTLSSEYYGFSTTDAQSLALLMNSRYNIRCAPAVSLNPKQAPQLFSLCQDPTCPLAVPNSDCEAYANLSSEGPSSSSPSPSESSSSTSGPTTITNSESSSSPTESPSAAATSSGSKGLSTGGIAGVAIGGAALLAFIIAAIFYLRRKRRPKTPPPQPEQPETRWTGNTESFDGSQAGGKGYLSPQSENFTAYSPNSRDSYISHAHTSYIPNPVELATPPLPQGPPAELSGEVAVSTDEYRRSRGMI